MRPDGWVAAVQGLRHREVKPSVTVDGLRREGAGCGERKKEEGM